jgi:hypothetical protein
MSKREFRVNVCMIIKAKNEDDALAKGWDAIHYGTEETAHMIPPKGIEMIWIPRPTLFEGEY